MGTPKEFAGIPDMEARSKKLYISGARSYGEEAVGHSGLTDDITDNDLEQYFSQYGTVTSIDQKVWPDTGKKRGYGYIEFDDEDAVDKIVLLGIHIIGGARMEARKGLSKEQQEAIRNGQVRTQGKLAQRAAENGGGYGRTWSSQWWWNAEYATDAADDAADAEHADCRSGWRVSGPDAADDDVHDEDADADDDGKRRSRSREWCRWS